MLLTCSLQNKYKVYSIIKPSGNLVSRSCQGQGLINDGQRIDKDFKLLYFIDDAGSQK